LISTTENWFAKKTILTSLHQRESHLKYPHYINDYETDDRTMMARVMIMVWRQMWQSMLKERNKQETNLA